MSQEQPEVSLSQLDEERFGIRTARVSNVTSRVLHSVLDFCQRNQVSFLIARCSASDLRAAQAMEHEGFALMDTLVYYTRSLDKAIPEHSGQVTIRPFRPGEEREVVLIAGQSFRGYFGHYHADPRLDRDKCDEAYVSWAERSCLNRDDTSEVLIAEMDGRVAGFATLRLNDPHEGEGVLFGVAPFAQNHGIYRSFMVDGMKWCQSKRAQRMIVSTQITNVAVQKVWTRLGFELGRAQYTFHKWFDAAGSA